jgi:cytosol alanyl aminopeptidase
MFDQPARRLHDMVRQSARSGLGTDPPMRLLPLLLVLAACAAPRTSAPAPATATPAPTPAPAARAEPKLVSPGLRLPDGARPRGYQLELTVLPGQDRFSGVITIDLEVTKPLDVLWLNATDLELTAATLTRGTGSTTLTPRLVDEHFAALVPQAGPLTPGPGALTVTFSGVLSRKDSDGLFQLKEGDEWYAYTSFEPIDARRAFPHFDEPGFKVPWELSLVVKPGHVALANSPQVSREPVAGGLERVRFAKSPPMPSYLVAVAVGPFEFVDGGTHGQKKTPVRIITPKGKAAEAAYAAQTTGPILEQLEAYFGSPYPYEKLDQIALPVATGAMENPGLVTYGHQLILARAEADTPSRQRSFAGVCTHELAHQWFGDLVTMAWWDDLWLNEAFATWMTPRILETWQPTWGIDVQQVGRRNGALAADALANARQIRQPIRSNDDIANAFDGITYGKGASVIGMFETFVGRETFQKGVRAYLAKHAWGNATADDFLSAISAAAGRDVAPAFKTFLDQPGAPVITFALSCEKGRPPEMAMAQKRSLPVGSTADAARQWRLPVCVRWAEKGKESRACTVLEAATGTLELTGAKACPDWVLPNDRFDGYYRASLTGPLSLNDVLTKAGTKLSIPERVGVIGDVSSLIRSGDLDAAAALSLAETASKESNRHVLGAALGLASYGSGDTLPEALRPKQEAFVRALFSKKLEALGWAPRPKEDEDTRLVRPSLLATLGYVGKDPKVLAESRRLAQRWVTDRKAMHPDVVDVVLGLAGDSGDAVLHAKLLTAAKQEKDRADRGRLLGALSAFSDRSVVSSQLPLVLTDTFDTREVMRLVWGAADDFRTRDLALGFVKEHWEPIITRLPKDGGAGLVWLAAGICETSERDAAKAFFDGRSTKYLGGPRNFALAMENIDLCLAWRARHRPSLVSFFEKRK